MQLVHLLEKLVKNLEKPEKPKKEKEENPALDAIYKDIGEKLKQRLSTKVVVNHKGKGAGKIEIEFYNHDDLDRLLEMIGNTKGE